MAIPPNPPPPPGPGPGGGGIGPGPQPPVVNPPKSKKASPLPLIVAIVAMLVSVGLDVVTLGSHGPDLLLNAIGWLLSPIVIAVCAGWDQNAQFTASSKDPWFIRNDNSMKVLRGMIIVGFLVAAPHINALASICAELAAS